MIGATRPMHCDTRGHFGVAGLGGGDGAHLEPARAGTLLRQRAFARARSSKNEFFHAGSERGNNGIVGWLAGENTEQVGTFHQHADGQP